ncbi:MAG: hypothetical protein OK474_06980, partial [Thaumarchaeota archaeon]|nr:hypothetical protein [Nitrososphaerota archaeon]
SLPKVTGGFSGTSHPNTVTTSNPDDLIVDFEASQGNPTYAPLSGYNSVVTQEVPSWMASSAEYKVVSSPQSGSSLGFTLSVGESGSQIVDAVVSASSSSVIISGPPPPSSHSPTASRGPEASLRAPGAPPIPMTGRVGLIRSERPFAPLAFSTGCRLSVVSPNSAETHMDHISTTDERAS